MYISITCVSLNATFRHAHPSKTGSADGPAPAGNRPSADAGMAKRCPDGMTFTREDKKV